MRALALLLSLTVPAGLQAEPLSPGFFLRAAEGWFWYAPDPAPPPEPLPTSPVPDADSTPAQAEAAPPAPLSAAWLRQALPRYRDLAIDDPSPAHVGLYLYLQRVALDKASRFTEVAQGLSALDPVLDETSRRPTATFAANAVNREAAEARDTLLTALGRNTGLLFFFRSDCAYCALQAPVLAMLERGYGLTVLPVSVDGGQLPGGLYPSARVDRGQARALGVERTPALFLARPPDAVVPLAQGVLSLEQIKDRILIAAREAGWLSPVDFERTRPLQDGRLLAVADTSSLPAEPEPEALLAYLQGLARAAGTGSPPDRGVAP